MRKAAMFVSVAGLALWPLAAAAQSAAAGGTAPADLGTGASPSAALPATQPAPIGNGSTAAPPVNNGTALAEVVVTAQRRSERLQDVPISVNVISATNLTTRGVINTQDLPTLVPGLTFATTGGSATPYLRGVGSNAGNPNDEASVATYVDGVYIADAYTNLTELNNINRIEVLKGPQGTLFGRNATGGVIQIITLDPKQTPEVNASIGYANYNTPSGSIYATAGLAPHLAADLAVEGSSQMGGWGTDLTTGQPTFRSNSFSARSKLLWEPTSNLTFHLSADYGRTLSHGIDYKLPPGALAIDGQPSPPGKYDTYGDITYDGTGEPRVMIQQYGISLRTDYATPYGKFVMINAYRHSKGISEEDPDAVGLPIENVILDILQHNQSQEIQYQAPSGLPFQLTAGVYYYNNVAGYNNVTINGLALAAVPGMTETLTGLQQVESESAYAQASTFILPKLQLTGGIRFTHERDRFIDSSVFTAPLPFAESGYDKPTWRGALDYAFTRDIHAYISDNRGVKGGGFDLLSPGDPAFKPEVLDAYEAGVKTELLNRRLRFNAAYFYYSYDNIQVQVIPAGASTGLVETTNAAAARIQGVDADGAFIPLPHMTISGGFAYLDGTYTNYDNAVVYPPSPLQGGATTVNASGSPTVRTPKYTANGTIAYEVQSEYGKFPLSFTTSYNSGYFFGADRTVHQDPYILLNTSAAWVTPDGRYSIEVWGRNLSNAYYLVQGVPSALGSLTAPESPRTYGFTLRAKFGG